MTDVRASRSPGAFGLSLPPPEPAPRLRRAPARVTLVGRGPGLRLTLTAVGLLGVVGAWSAAVTRDVDLAIFLALMMALSGGPFLVYLCLVHTEIGSVLVGAGLLLVSLGLPAAFARRSSPVLGLLAAMPLDWIVVGLGVALDRALGGRRSRGAGL